MTENEHNRGPRPRWVPHRRSILVTRPDLADEIDLELAAAMGLDLVSVSAGTHARLPWRHIASNGTTHRWSQSGNSRVQMDAGCPVCRGYVADESTSLASIAPDVAGDWHPTANGGRTPHDVTAGSRRTVSWLCGTCGYDWLARVSSRVLSGTGCPRCAGQAAQRGDATTLAVAAPDLFDEVDHKRAVELGVDPERVQVYSQRHLPWRCRHDRGHRWVAAPAARMNGCGCPMCPSSTRTSAVERRLLDLMRRHFVDADGDTPAGDTRWADGRGRLIAARCDVVIASRRVVVEYDGLRYHHSATRRRCDQDKTTALLANGWRVVRIREAAGQRALPELGITAQAYLELSHRYSRPLSPVVDRLLAWLRDTDE